MEIPLDQLFFLASFFCSGTIFTGNFAFVLHKFSQIDTVSNDAIRENLNEYMKKYEYSETFCAMLPVLGKSGIRMVHERKFDWIIICMSEKCGKSIEFKERMDKKVNDGF
ncbi:hypothetical protein TNCV_2014671 [Trichonephila clavipes]|nr:hypothetical protein TNCV_2014671 [Trichonephila clavipes]